jgi:hypothetical protein
MRIHHKVLCSSAASQLIVVCKKIVLLTSAEAAQLLAPPVDSDETERSGSPPWCYDEAAPIALGVSAPQAMKSAASQLIVVCIKKSF